MLTKPMSEFAKRMMKGGMSKMKKIMKARMEKQKNWRSDVRSGKVEYYDSI